MVSAIRGQSSLIGTILLTAVVIILVSTVSFVVLSEQQKRIDRSEPNIALTTELDSGSLLISHAGGQSYPFNQLRVELQTDSAEERYDLSDTSQWTATDTDSDTRFEPAERISISYSLSGQIRVRVYTRTEQGTNFILYDEVK